MKRALSFLAAAVILFGSSARVFAPAVRCVETEEKVVALTFDDGPHPTLTCDILKTLEKYGVRATFFVIGQNADNYPDALRMAVSLGHEIGNHTYTHRSILKKGQKEIKDEIERAEEKILSVCGAKTKVFRPPEGCYNKDVAAAAGELGYSVILWNIDTRDWAHRGTAEIVSNIKKNIRPGSVILFHDYVSGTSHTRDVLETIVPYLLTLGYRFVTVSELLES